MKINLGNKQFAIFALVLVTLFFAILFGFAGAGFILGFILAFITPTYLIMDIFNLDFEEKLFFSFFVSLAVYPSFVYALGMLFSSLRIAMIITFFILIGVGLILRTYKNKI